MNVINYAVEATNTCGYYISTGRLAGVIFSTIALKIELVFIDSHEGFKFCMEIC